MSLTFDTSKKSGTELVLEKRVPLRILGKNYVYLMTNDFTEISNKLKSFGCRIPKPEDFKENPALAKNVIKKMIDLGANWSLTITSEIAVLNYYESKSKTSYIVFLENLTSSHNNSTIINMFNYVSDNKTDEIKELIESGYDVDQCIESGATPLMIACIANAHNSVKTLIELGADINFQDANGQTPLMFTTFKNAVNSAKILLKNQNLKIDAKDYTGSTALMRTAAYGSVEVLKILIKAGADINAVNYSGENALIRSVINNNNTIVQVLLQSGINVNLVDKNGRSPLMVAAQYNNAIIAKQIIKGGADISLKDINNNTAFLIAAENNSTEILQILINTNKVTDEEYTQAVVKAAMKGNIDVIDILLKKAKKTKEMAFAALTSACLKNNSNIVHVCMDYDCNLDDTLYFGMTPLMMACYANSNEVAAQLLAYDADINKVDEDGITALMYSASKNNPVLLMLLMRNGADPRIKDKNGKTFEDYTKKYDARSFSQFLFDKMNSSLPESEKNRKDDIPKNHQCFLERFDWYMQKYRERFPNNKQSKIYNDAGISKQTFSKILSNRKPDFRPKKDTVIQLSLGLKLTINETEDFLQCAGYAFSEHDKKDIEVRNLLNENIYDKNEWSNRIYDATGKIFFKALIECEESE